MLSQMNTTNGRIVDKEILLEPETRTTRSTVWRLGGNLNGQKGSETTYKDDEVISSKGWNENGKPE